MISIKTKQGYHKIIKRTDFMTANGISTWVQILYVTVFYFLYFTVTYYIVNMSCNRLVSFIIKKIQFVRIFIDYERYFNDFFTFSITPIKQIKKKPNKRVFLADVQIKF